MVCSTQVELADELSHNKKLYRNDNYVKDLSNGKDYNYYKSTDHSSIIKIDYITNHSNIYFHNSLSN